MAANLPRLAKLLALAEAPATGSQEEAKAAAMEACRIIREEHLSVWDPSDRSTVAAGLDREELAALYAAAQDANPVRTAMRQRKEDRLRKEQSDAAERRTKVG